LRFEWPYKDKEKICSDGIILNDKNKTPKVLSKYVFIE